VAEPVSIGERRGVALATVMARKGVTAEALGERLGVYPPVTPQAVRGESLTLIATGPGVWLAVADTDQDDWAEALESALRGIASVSEQTAGYTVLRMTGPGAGALLQKGAFIDLDPAVFAVGAAAVTVIAHIGVILWKVDEAPSFDVAVFRSLAGSFRAWVTASAADMPVEIS